MAHIRSIAVIHRASATNFSSFNGTQSALISNHNGQVDGRSVTITNGPSNIHVCPAPDQSKDGQAPESLLGSCPIGLVPSWQRLSRKRRLNDAVPPSEYLGSLKVHDMAGNIFALRVSLTEDQLKNYGYEMCSLGRWPAAGIRACHHY
jgi:hypothetical protein